MCGLHKDKKTNKDVDEASDTYDAIDWMVKNLPYNNGRVGVSGSPIRLLSTDGAARIRPESGVMPPRRDRLVQGDDFQRHTGAVFTIQSMAS